jgi:hypothetical protein
MGISPEQVKSRIAQRESMTPEWRKIVALEQIADALIDIKAMIISAQGNGKNPFSG